MYFLILRILSYVGTHMRRQIMRPFQHIMGKIFLVLISTAILGFYTLNYFEPDNIIFSNPTNYIYYFITTATTIGYGDMHPNTVHGRVVVSIIMLIVVGTMAAFVSELFNIIIAITERRRSGMIVINKKNHLLIMGYVPSFTDEIINQILADKKRNEKHIVVCASLEVYPVIDPAWNKYVHFVQADTYRRNEIATRTNAVHAARVLVHGERDEDVFMLCTVMNSIVPPHIAIIAMLNHHSSIDLLANIQRDNAIQGIVPYQQSIIVQELQDPGSAALIREVISNGVGSTVYKSSIPPDVSWNINFLELFIYFAKHYNSNIWAIEDMDGTLMSNPAHDYYISGGMHIFYVAPQRIAIDWFDDTFINTVSRVV